METKNPSQIENFHYLEIGIHFSIYQAPVLQEYSDLKIKLF